MDIKTLEKANHLNRKFNEFTEALECFEWEDYEGQVYSTNPTIIIEFDRDGREQHRLPMRLSNELIAFLKSEIIKGRDAAVAEFNAL